MSAASARSQRALKRRAVLSAASEASAQSKRHVAVMTSFARWAASASLPTKARDALGDLLSGFLSKEERTPDRLAESLSAPLACLVISFLDTSSHVRVARCSKALYERGRSKLSWPDRIDIWVTQRVEPAEGSSWAAVFKLFVEARPVELSIRDSDSHWESRGRNLHPVPLDTSLFAGYSSLRTLRLGCFELVGKPIELPVEHLTLDEFSIVDPHWSTRYDVRHRQAVPRIEQWPWRLPQLRSVSGIELTDRALAWLSPCAGVIQRLSAVRPTEFLGVQDDLLARMPSLTSLSVPYLNDDAWVALAGRKLTELCLLESAYFDLQPFVHLRRLTLRQFSPQSDSIRGLAGLTQLTRLSLQFDERDYLDPDIEPLAALPCLSALHLGSRGVVLNALVRFPELTELGITRPYSTQCALIASLSRLRRLEVRFASVLEYPSSAEVAPLGKSSSLAEIAFHRTSARQPREKDQETVRALARAIALPPRCRVHFGELSAPAAV